MQIFDYSYTFTNIFNSQITIKYDNESNFNLIKLSENEEIG